MSPFFETKYLAPGRFDDQAPGGSAARDPGSEMLTIQLPGSSFILERWERLGLPVIPGARAWSHGSPGAPTRLSIISILAAVNPPDARVLEPPGAPEAKN